MIFGFRSLTDEEIEFVAGTAGTIVNGQRTIPYAAGAGQIGSMGSWRSGDASAREDAEERAREDDEDSDGDGIPNWVEEPIVVTALTPAQIAAANSFADQYVNMLQGVIAIGTGVAFIEIGALQGALAAVFGNARIGHAILNVATLAGTTVAVSELRQVVYEAVAIEIQNGTFYEEPVPGDWDYTGSGWPYQ